MSITASLAISQLKRKRVRSLATILAIILSTSLTTAVCSFIASGNKMLIDMLGTDYGDYGSAYFSMLLIPGILFGFMIAAMSIIVISNVFRVSAGERISEFGTLKCVGATENQITETVMYESIFLSLIGIPCGIVLGILFTHLGIGVANRYLDELNSLVHMMMTEITFSLKVVISWKALLLSAVISLCTVLLSAFMPAKKSAKIAAIDCIRNSGNISAAEKQNHRKGLKPDGTIEKELAFVNVRRNKRNTRASVIVLSISIIMFISLSGIKSIAEEIEDYMNQSFGTQTVIVEYLSNYDETENINTGRTETHYTKPIQTDLAETITDELRAYDDNDFFGYGDDSDTYFVRFSQNMLTPDMIEAQEFEQGNQATEYEFPVEIIVLDTQNYEKLCVSAGVEPGANILLNAYSYNRHGTEEKIVPFYDTIQELTLETADGTETNVTVDGILTRENIPSELLFPNMDPVLLVVPEAEIRGFSWASSPSDLEGYIEYANQVMDKYFPTGESDSYMEQGFNTRVFKTDEYMKVMNVAILLGCVFLYSFVILLATIGIINVISTISTNVQMREREFAVLESIGMTSDSLRKMLNTESILCAGKALLIGLPIGFVVILLVNLSVREMFPLPFCMPWKEILLVIILVFLVIWCTMRFAAGKRKNQNIIETIRKEH